MFKFFVLLLTGDESTVRIQLEGERLHAGEAISNDIVGTREEVENCALNDNCRISLGEALSERCLNAKVSLGLWSVKILKLRKFGIAC